jgi:hypothetical protein
MNNFFQEAYMRNYRRPAKVLLGILSLLILMGTVNADDRNDCDGRPQRSGEVLPPDARVHGFLLEDAAEATAVYNTGIQSGNPLTPPPPDVPFHVLVGDATVCPGTTLYVPVFVSDDSAPIPAGFPAHIANQDADADFLDALVLNDFGVTAFIVQVDGKTTILSDDYITGVKTAPLLDGTPAGTHYISSAAFVTPLEPGKHTVGIGGIIGGAPVVFLTYNVTVQ